MTFGVLFFRYRNNKRETDSSSQHLRHMHNDSIRHSRSGLSIITAIQFTIRVNAKEKHGPAPVDGGVRRLLQGPDDEPLLPPPHARQPCLHNGALHTLHVS